MLSPVRHKTRATINRAKRSGLGNSPRPMGITIDRRVKDIATDTLVNKRVFGEEWGETPYNDALMTVIGIIGVSQLLMSRRVKDKEEFMSDAISVGLIGLSLFHLIPTNITLPR